MKRITFLLVVVATLAGVAAFTVTTSHHVTAQEAAPIFVKEIPPGYRDWRVVSNGHEAGDLSPAQQVGARRIDLQRHDLNVPRREVIQVIVELEPGTTAPRHTHPGEEIIYVLEGTWEYTLEGKPPLIVRAGEVLFIPAGTIHSARIVGTQRC
ncbi:MAG TPA: cupin domain-containing protein [Pyrinomonadaceae bacterium]|nr:cupin domain-containing protein [Pyrinomonadaceae bacterium]